MTTVPLLLRDAVSLCLSVCLSDIRRYFTETAKHIIKQFSPSSSRTIFSGVARNLIWGGVYVLTSHCNYKTCVNVPHVNKTVTDFGGIYTDIPPIATPLTILVFPYQTV